MTIDFRYYLKPCATGLSLAANEVHLWAIPLSCSPDIFSHLTSVLSADEANRAGRFRFKRDRHRFTAARAALRLLLSQYTGTPAAGLEFAYGAHGKPMLPSTGLHFNLAHRETLSLVGVAASTPLGVDMEWLDRSFDHDAFISNNASDAERAAFAALRQDERLASFFCWWTRKEAVLKALGCGLSLPLTAFDVSISPHQAELLGSRLRDIEGEWTLVHLNPENKYTGCLAIPRRGWQVRAWRIETISSLLVCEQSASRKLH
jgi:4'-phosphopantetheinyl transferase